jgi:hypothetical protein
MCVQIDSNIVVFVSILDIMSDGEGVSHDNKSRYLYHREWRKKRKELYDDADRLLKKFKREHSHDSQSEEVTGGDAGVGDSGDEAVLDDRGLSDGGRQPQSIGDDDDESPFPSDDDAGDSGDEEVVDNADDDEVVDKYRTQ